MKYCPTCQTRYADEVMRFCTKDGTPLIDEEQPNFKELPSKSSDSVELDDEMEEQTVVRRIKLNSESDDEPARRKDSQRLVVPVSEDHREQQQKAGTSAVYRQPPPHKSNTAMVVVLTMLGTIVVIGGAIGAYMLFSGDKREEIPNMNLNLNANQNVNMNTNLAIDNTILDTNFNTNFNANTDLNTNLKTPTPSPTPTKTPTPSPTPTPDEDDNTNTNINSNRSNANTPANTRPTATPSPRTTPPPANTNRSVNAGNLTSRAVNLIKPVFPVAAKTVRVSGPVIVQVLVDETGKVVSANAISGHPLLRPAAENAARRSQFDPVRVSGQAVKTTGTVVYNFVNP